MRDPEAVTFPQQAEAIISAAALYADKERPDLAQEVQDVDLPCNIPGSKGIGAPFSRLDPVHPAAELLKLNGRHCRAL